MRPENHSSLSKLWHLSTVQQRWNGNFIRLVPTQWWKFSGFGHSFATTIITWQALRIGHVRVPNSGNNPTETHCILYLYGAGSAQSHPFGNNGTIVGAMYNDANILDPLFQTFISCITASDTTRRSKNCANNHQKHSGLNRKWYQYQPYRKASSHFFGKHYYDTACRLKNCTNIHHPPLPFNFVHLKQF